MQRSLASYRRRPVVWPQVGRSHGVSADEWPQPGAVGAVQRAGGHPRAAPGRLGGVTHRFDDATLQAVGELLALGEQEGYGVTFTPDNTGWTVGYMCGMGGGDLLAGFDLGDTARGSVRPLLDLIARSKAARRERE
jgi:hypothetical protein